MTHASDLPEVQRYARHVNPAFVRLLGTFGYGRVFVRGKGTRVWDHEGREYLDCLAAFGATSLGHSPRELIEKMHALLDDDTVNLVHVGPQIHAGDLAADLAALAGDPLEVTLFSSSGGEAVEAAMKLARAATKRTRILYARGGFHGTGMGPLSVMGSGRMRDPFEPLVPACVEIPFGDVDALERALEEEKTAALMIEPIQAEAGVIVPPRGYLQNARDACRRRGALFVLDEVQTGIGRTGAMFAYEHEGVTPDVLVLGKALGGGMVPISATITSREIQQRAYGSTEKFDLHGTTYAGNAFACRVAREVLRITGAHELSRAAKEKGDRLLAGLKDGVGSHPLVREIRGKGLLIGIELGPTESGGLASRLLPGLVSIVSKKVFGQWLALRLLERGILCQPASQQWNVLRFEPPLTITDDEIDRVIRETKEILGEYTEILPLMKDVAERLGKQMKDGWSF